jgi:hypothetical protein
MLSGGIFQVYALEGVGKGIVGGKLSTLPNPSVLFDRDFTGLDAAIEKFRGLVKEAEEQGFKRVTLIDELEFQAKLRAVARK